MKARQSEMAKVRMAPFGSLESRTAIWVSAVANACAHNASGQPGGQFMVRLRQSGSSRGEVYVEVEDQGSAWDGLLRKQRVRTGCTC
jgi:hypothetical protein